MGPETDSDRQHLGNDNSNSVFIFLISLMNAHIFRIPVMDHPLNEQREWGGRAYPTTSTFDTGGQNFLASQPAADTDPSQVPFTASSDDDLFAPATGGPSQFRPYILPINIPSFHHRRCGEVHTPTVPNSFADSVHPPVQVPNVHFSVPPLYHSRTPGPLHYATPLHPISPRIHPSVPHNLPDMNNPPPVPHTTAYPTFPPYPPYQSHGPLPYHAPHIQYVYVPTPPMDTSLSAPSSKSLPVITTIHSLNSKADFYAWDEGVCTLLRLLGIYGHIVDPTLLVDPLRSDISPALPPPLSQPPAPAELRALTRWQDNDNIAQYVIIGRLGGLAPQLLPSAYMATRTAYTMYTTLTRYFGLRNFGDCDELANSLLQFRCDPTRVQDYVARWRAGVARLCSAKYPFSTRVFINAFVKSLPNTITFATLRAFLPDRLASWHDSDIGSFITVTNEVMDLEVAFRHSHSSSQSRPGPRPASLATQMLAPPPPLPNPPPLSVLHAPAPEIPVPQPRVPRQTLTCGNCKDWGLRFTGHTDATCFQPGGGMEGRREEYMSNKGRFHAMFVECLDNASSSCEPITHSGSLSSPSSPLFPPTLDDEIVMPPLVNLCVASSTQNDDLRGDLYIPCSFKFPPLSFASIDFKSASMVSMVSLYNALLDSGCTHHIVPDRRLFRSYVAKPVSVGTANCGSLNALGTGDVEFRYPFGNHHVIFTLRGCLYAPDAPITLLSVGALVERGMSCLFSPGGITKVFYPEYHTKFPGFTFSATVSNRLSFLKLDFISPDTLALNLPAAFPAHAVIPSIPEMPPSSIPLSAKTPYFGTVVSVTLAWKLRSLR
jgi:hypothetical protein